MPESETTNTLAENEFGDREMPALGGPGSQYVGTAGIITVVIYLIIAVVTCLYALVKLWPTPTPARTPQLEPAAMVATNTASQNSDRQKPDDVSRNLSAAPATGDIEIFGHRFQIADEIRLLLIVSFAGALGSLVHSLRSVFWYVGNRELVWSWVCRYILQPFSGTALSVVFYLVVRGGFFSPQAGFQQTSPFGFAALGAVVGMFSEQAVLKLKQVAETVLAKPEPGKDSKPQYAVEVTAIPAKTPNNRQMQQQGAKDQ